MPSPRFARAAVVGLAALAPIAFGEVVQINPETTADFSESAGSFTLVLVGTRVDDDRNTPIMMGEQWRLNLVLTLDNTGSGDSVGLQGSIYHAGDPAGGPVTIADLLHGADDPPLFLNFRERYRPHGTDWDYYTQAGTYQKTGNQFEGWTLTITGQHTTTPAPGSAALLGLGGLVAGARRRHAGPDAAFAAIR